VARIYYGSFLSIENIEYKVELWNGPSGSSTGGTELTLTGNGFEIQRQGEGDTYYTNYARPSRINTFWHMPSDTVRNAFIDIANNQESTYAILVYRAGSLFYVGRVIADQADYLRESINGAPVFSLVAVDSLNLLEGFNVSPSWFTNGYATGLEIIRQSLAMCQLDDYWTYLSVSTYLRDGVTMYDTAQASYKGLANTRFNLLSFYDGFDPFSDVEFIDTTDPYIATTDIDLITCKAAIEQILSIYGSRITLESGAFWILPQDAYSATNLSTRIYNAAGTYQSTGTTAHAVALAANDRPQWEAKPTLSYQPPVRQVDVIEERQNAMFAIRLGISLSTLELSLSNKTIEEGKPTRVRMMCKWQDNSFVALSTSTAKRYYRYLFNYRIYFMNGAGQYRQYSPNLNAYFTPVALPLYMQQPMTVSAANNAWNTHIVDFVLPEIPAGFTQMYAEFYLEGEEGLFVAPNNWASSANYAEMFWGTVSAAQPYGSIQNPTFERTTKNSVAVSGASGNSQLIELKPAYYDGEGLNGFGTIYVYNGTTWVVSSDWYSGYASATHAELSEILGKRIGGQYSKFVKTVRGTWHDAGALSAIKSLSFDSAFWLFNGGTYNPRLETWSGEWLAMAPDYTLATGGGGQDWNPRTGERVVTNRLNYHEFAITKLNLETSAMQDRVLEYLVNQADGAPTTQPTENTLWEVMLKYTDSSGVLEWHLQEHNSPVTYTAGSHTITNGYELILCDSSGGTVNVDLPDPTQNKGKKYYFKKIASSHTVVITGGGADIDGSPTKVLNTNYETTTVICDGVQWWVV
jgi:hypothetical protein